MRARGKPPSFPVEGCTLCLLLYPHCSIILIISMYYTALFEEGGALFEEASASFNWEKGFLLKEVKDARRHPVQKGDGEFCSRSRSVSNCDGLAGPRMKVGASGEGKTEVFPMSFFGRKMEMERVKRVQQLEHHTEKRQEAQRRTIDCLRPMDLTRISNRKLILHEVTVTPVREADDLIALGFVTSAGTSMVTIPRANANQLGQALIRAADADFVGSGSIV
jgi:hypothetical protein